MEFSALYPFIIQGITEVLPISSTAHLLLMAKDSSLSMSTLEAASLHLIPGLVFSLYFWRDIKRLWFYFWEEVKTFFLKPSSRRLWEECQISFLRKPATFCSPSFILLTAFCWAVIPALFCGLFLDVFGVSLPSSRRLIGINSILFGSLLAFADRSAAQKTVWDIRSGLIFGIFHCLAFIPGVSRLGICLTTARALGFSRSGSLRFSFLSGIPLLLCAGTYSLLKAFQETAPALPDHFWLYSGLTFGLAFLSLIFLMKYVRKHNLLVFALYRIILGFVLLL